MTDLATELDALRAEKEAVAEPVGSLAEMNDLAAMIAELRDAKKEAEEVVSKLSAQLELSQKRVIDIMTENSLKSYKAPMGTMTVKAIFTARLPKDDDKAKLFDYLKSINRFEEMASIHSMTFNSWVQEEYDLAKERGDDEPKLPGVTDVKILPRLSFTRAK